MAKSVKNKQIYARIDEDMSTRVAIYARMAPGLDMAELVRRSIEEYMINHPIKEKQEA